MTTGVSRIMTTNARFLLPGLAAAALTLAGCHKQADESASTAPATSNSAAAASGPASAAPAGGWTEQVAATPDGGYLMGNPNAPVKLIEYGSRTCPHCGAFAKEGLPDLKSKYIATGKVSYEFRDFAIHAPDVAAILLGQCNGPATFFPILEGMFADQENTLPKLETLPQSFQQGLQGKTPTEQAAAWADEIGYLKFVGQRGVPEAKGRACLADSKAIDALIKHMDEGSKRYNITGTPAFIVNGTTATDVYDWKTLEPALKAAGA
jgi:protein-disulfide isomerase